MKSACTRSPWWACSSSKALCAVSSLAFTPTINTRRRSTSSKRFSCPQVWRIVSRSDWWAVADLTTISMNSRFRGTRHLSSLWILKAYRS
uniref:Putative secreted protein n=1 Tax=Ixodes ricinus TaxID=34613 RepID=A0A6B0UBG1_IXORI